MVVCIGQVGGLCQSGRAQGFWGLIPEPHGRGGFTVPWDVVGPGPTVRSCHREEKEAQPGDSGCSLTQPEQGFVAKPTHPRCTLVPLGPTGTKCPGQRQA